jgi:Fungal specific transcription factor domain
MCVLCNDTFSRSDILKRHFQKCSVRRGNPTGASHLSNPAAHLKKSQAAAQKAAQNAAAAGGTNSPASASTPVSAGPYTTTSMPGSNIPTTAGAPPPSALSYAMESNAQGEMQRAAPNQAMQGAPNATNQWAMHHARNNQMLYHQNSTASADHFDDKRNAMPNAHAMGDEWNQMYMNPMFSGYEQSQGEVKNEHHESASNGFYIPPTSIGADGTPGPPLWSILSASLEDPIQLIADRLVDFCFPAGIQESLQEQQNNASIRRCLTVDSIKHFIHLYSNFQVHFPWLHLPTFNIFDTYDGLFLAVICSGAVYSDRVSPDQVRALLRRVQDGIQRTAEVLRHFDGPTPRFSSSGIEHDELLSMHMLSNLLIWHGGPVEREIAFNLTKQTQTLARRYGMLKLAERDDDVAFSYLHNLSPGDQAVPTRWNWQKWVEQEKRLRLMFLIYSFDAALCMYWNYREPTFASSEVTLPMPCDDAAWEATDSESCAQSLGLRGPGLQARFNTTGSTSNDQRLQQIHSDTRSARRDLASPASAGNRHFTNLARRSASSRL